MTDSDTQSSSQELPLLTFNSLYNVLREEKKGKSLQQLPELFYEALEKFLTDKKEEIKRLKEAQEKDKLKKERNILSNSKKIAQDLLSLRGTKISSIAIQNALSEDNVLNEDNVLEKEKDLFNAIQTKIKNLEKKVL